MPPHSTSATASFFFWDGGPETDQRNDPTNPAFMAFRIAPQKSIHPGAAAVGTGLDIIREAKKEEETQTRPHEKGVVPNSVLWRALVDRMAFRYLMGHVMCIRYNYCY